MASIRRFTNLFRRPRLEREIAAELQAHIDLRTDDNIARGMPPSDARREAILRFGNPTSTRERVTAADAHLRLENLLRDLRYAGRRLRNAPGFAFIAIVTLAVGIAASVVVFGVMNALILRPLNVANADQLMEVVQKDPGYDTQSYPDYLDYRSRQTSFADMATFRIAGAGLSSGGSSTKSWVYEVSGNYFDMLGVQPEAGRLIHASDEHGPNSAPYVVLSDGFWRSRFNGDPRVVGTIVDLNKHPFTIIGVAPRTFNGTELFLWPDFWVPMVNEEQVEGYSFLTKRFSHGIFVLGSVKPGISTAQATQDLDNVARGLQKEHPVEDGGMAVRLVKPGLMADSLSGPAQAFMAALLGLALLVMLAACTNLAGIVIARVADRSRELAIRMSIGSTRWRILRQLIAEVTLLCLGGGLVGTMFAALSLRALSEWQPVAEYPIHVTVLPDARVWLVAVALSLASALLPALLPARQIWRTNAMQTMKGGTGTTVLLRRFTLRDVLLGVQIAVCAVLVTASLVAVRGIQHTLHAPIGIQPEGGVLATLYMQMGGYSDRAALPVQKRMLDEVARIPGVAAVGTINDVPVRPGGSTGPIFKDGTTDFRPQNTAVTAKYFSISPGYLQAAGTRLLAGRDITWADDEKSPRVALVNETFGRKLFGNASAVGQHFMEPGNTRTLIEGVVEDGKYESLTEDQLPAVFYALAQNPDSDTTLVVRSPASPAETMSAIRRVLTGIDSSVPLTVQTWPDSLALVLFPARVATAVLGVMGVLAAMLAVTGIFGMAAYSVSKRLRELGIRSALGARRTQLVRSALSRPLIVLLSGSFTGLLLGVLASRLLASIVYEATPRDPLVLTTAVLAMTLIGLLATWIPARRALHVDPAKLLREE